MGWAMGNNGAEIGAGGIDDVPMPPGKQVLTKSGLPVGTEVYYHTNHMCKGRVAPDPEETCGPDHVMVEFPVGSLQISRFKVCNLILAEAVSV